MKSQTLFSIGKNARSGYRAAAMCLWLGLGIAVPTFAQDYASQFGHALDANPRVGSYGLNTNARLDMVIPRGNLMITGNVGGGQSFQGLVPYANPAEFQGSTAGIGALSNFQRDSTGSENLSRPLGSPRYYFDPSRQITGTFAGQVTNTANVANYLNVTPVGRSMTMPSASADMSVRPFSQSIQPLSMPQQSAPDYANLQNLPVGAPKMPWMTESPLSKPGSKQPVNPAELSAKRSEGVASPDPQSMLESQQAYQNQISNSMNLPSESQPTAVDYYLQFQQQLQEQQSSAVASQSAEKSESSKSSSSSAFPAETRESPFPAKSLPEPSRLNASTPTSTLPKAGSELRQQQFQYFMKQGAQQIKQGNYYLAANTFDSAAIYMPDEPVIYIAKSHALFAAGEYMSAAFFLNRAFAMTPEIAKKTHNPIPLFASPEEFQKRLDNLKKWQQDTARPELLFLRGYLEYQIGSLAEAKDSLEKSLQTKFPPEPQLLSSIQLLLEIIGSAGTPVK